MHPYGWLQKAQNRSPESSPGPAYSGVHVAEGCGDAANGGRERRNVVGEFNDRNHLASDAVDRRTSNLGRRLRRKTSDSKSWVSQRVGRTSGGGTRLSRIAVASQPVVSG